MQKGDPISCEADIAMSNYSLERLGALAKYDFLQLGKSRDQLYLDALKHICTCMDWSVGLVYFPSKQSPERLRSSSLWYLENPQKFDMLRQVMSALCFSKGVGLPGSVLASKNPEWVADIRCGDPRFTRGKLAQDLGLLACFDFPVKGESGVIAVLEFFSKNPENPDSEMLNIINRITTDLAAYVSSEITDPSPCHVRN